MEVVIDGIEYVPKEQKEDPRQIDWSKVASHVPVQVWNGTESGGRTEVGFLSGRAVTGQFVLAVRYFDYAALLTDLWVPHISDECPLPEGVMVEAVARNGDTPTGESRWFCWQVKGDGDDIIRFRVTGLAPGWRW